MVINAAGMMSARLAGIFKSSMRPWIGKWADARASSWMSFRLKGDAFLSTCLRIWKAPPLPKSGHWAESIISFFEMIFFTWFSIVSMISFEIDWVGSFINCSVIRTAPSGKESAFSTWLLLRWIYINRMVIIWRKRKK